MIDKPILNDDESTGNSILYYVEGLNSQGEVIYRSTFLSYDMLEPRQVIVSSYQAQQNKTVIEDIAEWRMGAASFDTNKMLSFTHAELTAKPIRRAA